MKKNDFIHFIGIGGVSMSGIAIELSRQGFNVSGSDTSTVEENLYLQEIEKFGQIRLFDGGHSASNLDPNVKYLVVTSTISNQNPEIVRAKELGIKILQRFEVINLLIEEYKNRIGIFGGAGKTTTTALTFFLFQNAGLVPSLFLGSVLKNLMSSVHINYKKDFCIFETDESDATFELMDMNAGIFVTMEEDHLEHSAYLGSYSKMKERFANLLIKLKNNNSPICYNQDNADVKTLVESNLKNYKNSKSFSVTNKDADFYACNFRFLKLGTVFDLFQNGKLIKQNIFTPLIGEFNVLNLLGGIAMLSFFENNESVNSSILRLGNFEGIDKRQSFVGTFKNFHIIDDYAHSPIKIQSILHGFQNYTKAINAKFVTICEIHKASRLKQMYNSFLNSFKHSSLLIFIEPYKVKGDNTSLDCLPKLIKDLQDKHPEMEIHYSSNKDLDKMLYQVATRDEFKNNKANFFLFLGAGRSSIISKEMQAKLMEIQKTQKCC